MSNPDIPVIDVSALRTDDVAAHKKLASEMGDACRGLGFFCVTGHGIPPDQLQGMFDASRDFFYAPDAIKQAVSFDKSDHNRGWIGPEREKLDPSNAPDLKQAFNIGFEMAADDPEILAGTPFRGVNLWPDMPGFKATMLEYYNAVWKLGLDMHKAFSLDMGLAPDFFDDKFDAPLATLRLLYYPGPEAPPQPGQIGAGEHTDYGNITLLLTDGTPGLEVRTRDGQWIAPPQIENAFVCNIGDCLMRWTNDIYVSTPHRVQVPTRERYSIAFFLDPNPDAIVDVLPSCVSVDRPAKYPPVTGADYLKQKLDASYAFINKQVS